MSWKIEEGGATETTHYRACGSILGFSFGLPSAALALDGSQELGLLAVFLFAFAVSVAVMLYRAQRSVRFADKLYLRTVRFGDWEFKRKETSLQGVQNVTIEAGIDHPNVPRMRMEWATVTLLGKELTVPLGHFAHAATADAQKLAEHLAKGLEIELVNTP